MASVGGGARRNLIIFAAKIVEIAVPTTDKAVGNVDKDFIEVICDPIIPLKKTVIILAVNPKTWLKANSDKFLFIKFCNSDITNQQTQNQDP